ncbi:MAG: hypothetical protein K8S87_10400 [Planctomycetes bacterium]|nr:hypothetical protein [Planctomycetota bacterium]
MNTPNKYPLFIKFSFYLIGLIFLFASCSENEISPEKRVSTFLEAASFADIDTMKKLSIGRMKEELLRDEQALTKLVYFERQNIAALNTGMGNTEIDTGVKTTDKGGARDFDFTFQIMPEQTAITKMERAQVWVIMTRKNVSITRIYDLVWTKGLWMIESYNNQVGE